VIIRVFRPTIHAGKESEFNCPRVSTGTRVVHVPRGGGSLLVRGAVDTFAEQVGMPVVLGVLLDHVDDHGAH
jgi:hypothetical protein